MKNPHGLTIRAVPMSQTGLYQVCDIYSEGGGSALVRVIFRDDPMLIVYDHDFDALTADVMVAAIRLAQELARGGPDWRGDKDG